MRLVPGLSSPPGTPHIASTRRSPGYARKCVPCIGGEMPLRVTSGHVGWGIHANWRASEEMLNRHRGEPFAFVNDRAVFIVDKQGKIAWSKVYELKQQPDNAEILEAMKKLG